MHDQTADPAPPEAAPGVPLLALVLSGALRMRRHGEEAAEPPARG
jgi:MYXO-CTERM domain-containing protein